MPGLVPLVLALSRIPARGALQLANPAALAGLADLASLGLQQVLVSPYHGVSSQELQVHYTNNKIVSQNMVSNKEIFQAVH